MIILLSVLALFAVTAAAQTEIAGSRVINAGTTPTDALAIVIDQPGAPGTRDSHNILLTGTSDDGAGHDVDWFLFVDVTSNGGASILTWQSRIDAGSKTTRVTLTDAGLFDAATFTEGGNAVPNVTDNISFFAATTSLQLLNLISDETGSGPLSFSIAPTLQGIIDRTGTAVDDDECTGQQGSWWWDSTDSAFEFCNASSGAPDVIGGGAANSFGVIGAATADSPTDTLTVTDSTTIDFTTTNDPEDLTAIVIANSIGTAQVDETEGYNFSALIGTTWASGIQDMSAAASFEVPNGATPTTDAFGELAADNNAWAASRGALQHFDGTANTFVIAALSSDTPTDGQVIKIAMPAGTITWEDDISGGSPAWDTISVPGGNQTLDMDVDTTTFEWITTADATLDAWTMTHTNTSGTDTTTQTLFRLRSLNNAAVGSLNRFIEIDHGDGGTADVGILISETGAGTITAGIDITGTVTTGLDLSDAGIGVGIALGANSLTTTGVGTSIVDADLAIIDDSTITLTTETTGNYVLDVTCGQGLTGCVAASEGATEALALVADGVRTTELDDAGDTPSTGEFLKVAGTTTQIEYAAIANGDIDELLALADLTDVTAKTGSGTVVVMDTSPTIVTPTISATGFTNAQHAHAAANSGGQIPIGNTTGDLAESRVDDGGAATTEALFAGAGGAAGFRAIVDGDIPDGITANLYLLLAGGTLTGNVDWDDGTGDSPQAIFTPQTGTAFQLFVDDTGDDFRITAATSSTENVEFENTGTGLLAVFIETADGVLTDLKDAAHLTTGTVATARVGAGHIDALTEIDGGLCGTNEILEDQGASWACISTPTGGNSFGVIGAATADSANDTLTVTDSSTIDFTTTNDPEDLTAIVIAESIGTVQVDETEAYVFSALGATTWGASVIDASGATSLEVPNGANPTTDAFGELAADNDAWAASRGALEHFDGTASTFVLATLASDAPTDQQVPKWNTGGTITWEDDVSAGTPTWDSVSDPVAVTALVFGATAETTTFSYEAAYSTGSYHLIRQQTGNTSGGTLLDVRAADAQTTVFRAGDGTNGITVSQAGALIAEGTGTITATNMTIAKYVYFKSAGCQGTTAATGFNLPASNAPLEVCQTFDTDKKRGTLDFDDTTDENVFDGFQLPPGWTGAIDLDIVWHAASTTLETRWALQTQCVDDAEVPGSWNAQQSVEDTAKGTTLQFNDAAIATVTVTGCSADDSFLFWFYRDASDAGDDMSGDASLVSLRFTVRDAQ